MKTGIETKKERRKNRHKQKKKKGRVEKNSCTGH